MPNVTRTQRRNFDSDLDEIAREGARRMLAQARSRLRWLTTSPATRSETRTAAPGGALLLCCERCSVLGRRLAAHKLVMRPGRVDREHGRLPLWSCSHPSFGTALGGFRV